MAWEGSWTLAGTPGAYQAETQGLVGKDGDTAKADPGTHPSLRTGTRAGKARRRGGGVPLPGGPAASRAGGNRPLEVLWSRPHRRQWLSWGWGASQEIGLNQVPGCC